MDGDRFSVYLTGAAESDLNALRENRHLAARALLVLEQAPLTGHLVRGSLRGVRSLHFVVNGVAFRAAHTLDIPQRRWLIFIIGPRRGFYSRLCVELGQCRTDRPGEDLAGQVDLDCLLRKRSATPAYGDIDPA